MANSPDYIIEDGTFTSSIEEKNHIYYLHYLPKKKLPKKIIHVIFQHGMIEYHARHEPLFEALMNHFKQDIVISAMDLVGHGKSGGNRAFIDSFQNYTDDLLVFFDKCHERFYLDHQVETFVIAHSLGGLIMINLLADEEIELPFEINSLVLSNPCVSPNLQLPGFVEKMAESIPLNVSKMRVPLIYDAYDLTHDEERARAFIHDHLISKSITIRLGIETIRVSRAITRHSYFFRYPTLFLLSGEDKVVDNNKTRLFMAGMDKTRVELKEYPKMHHDILNETCRNEVFSAIISYIKNQLGNK